MLQGMGHFSSRVAPEMVIVVNAEFPRALRNIGEIMASPIVFKNGPYRQLIAAQN